MDGGIRVSGDTFGNSLVISSLATESNVDAVETAILAAITESFIRDAVGLTSANLATLLTKVMRYDETYTHTNTDTSEAATVAIVKV
jgi:hypothetical protein